jgi:uncharacterized phage protein (TIGR01671 family)
MNREIKFRAWDKKTQKMIATGYAVIGEVTMFNMVDQYISEHKDPDQPTLSRLKDIVEMQFTGLKDSKETEIYEGDLIVSGEDFPYVLVVGFNKQTAAFGGCRDASMCLEGWYSFLNDIVIDQDGWKVIGNIFENPELLKP